MPRKAGSKKLTLTQKTLAAERMMRKAKRAGRKLSRRDAMASIESNYRKNRTRAAKRK